MEKVIVQGTSMDPAALGEALGEIGVRGVRDRAELAEAIVWESKVVGVLIEADGVDEELEGFLRSLKRSFSYLCVGLITPEAPMRPAPELYTSIGAAQEPDALVRDIKSFVLSSTQKNRRRAHRFDWPLEGFLSLDGSTWTAYPVRALSSIGAFLEADHPGPPAGKHAQLRVVFQDSRMVTACDVLESREASDALPRGFGVRFTEFSAPSRAAVDRIVNDALVQDLLRPDDVQPVPSLGEETLTFDGELR